MTDSSGSYLVCEKVQAISPENENIIQMQKIYKKNENDEYKEVKTIFGFICGLSIFLLTILLAIYYIKNKKMNENNKYIYYILIASFVISLIISLVFQLPIS